MAFENDIFISYAHIDDQALIEGQKGWVSNLHRALEIRVAQLLGTPPRIWRDPKLQGNDVFGDELVHNLPRTAVLLCVLSPRYAVSDWCRRELSEFRRAADASGGLRVGNKTRVFKIVKTPVPLAQQPPGFEEMLGYEFFQTDAETGRARELDQAFGEDAQRQYWAKLDDLAYDLTEMLSVLAGNGQGAAPAADAKTIYVARTGFDLRDQRDEVVRDLARRGHRVLPEQPLPRHAEGLESYVRSALDGCDLSVHLIGQSYGMVPDGATRSVLDLQCSLAFERGREAGLARLVWIPPGLAAEDPRQIAFLERLRADATSHDGADLLETPLETLKTTIGEILQPPEKQLPEKPAAPVEGGGPHVYLICDQRDEEAVEPLADVLFDRGFEVTLPAFEGDAGEIREDHEENLRECDAALVYYGAGNELWIRRQLRELIKSAGYGRERPMTARAVYVAPPVTVQKRRLRTREATVLTGSETFDPSDLQPLLQLLGGEG